MPRVFCVPIFAGRWVFKIKPFIQHKTNIEEHLNSALLLIILSFTVSCNSFCSIELALHTGVYF